MRYHATRSGALERGESALPCAALEYSRERLPVWTTAPTRKSPHSTASTSPSPPPRKPVLPAPAPPQHQRIAVTGLRRDGTDALKAVAMASRIGISTAEMTTGTRSMSVAVRGYKIPGRSMNGTVLVSVTAEPSGWRRSGESAWVCVSVGFGVRSRET